MLIVFGAISMELHLPVNHFAAIDVPAIAPDYTLNAGGKAANQAFAAVRSGVKVALIGKTGDDDYARRILDKLRREGVITSGVAKSDETHTGLSIFCYDDEGNTQQIKSPGANAECSADQVPVEILDRHAIVLIQSDLGMEENLKLLSNAKKQATRTILNLSPSLSVNKEVLDKINYLILNSKNAQKLAEKLKLPLKDNINKIAQALAKFGNLTCIVTKSADGAVAYTSEGQGWAVPALKLDNVVDHSGAEDAYCGTFAACLHASMPLNAALKRASIAATLACKSEGGQSSFPYLAEIDEYLEGLGETVAL